MKKKQDNKEENKEDIKADLKHDTMEFSAAADGDDKMDMDDATYEEEEITGDELDTLETDEENETAALKAVEVDRTLDADNLPEEDWTDDLEDMNED